jgi:hypothetical protein
MKAKHKYILTLSTLALFVISVFIGYFISTRSISKAMYAEGGDCPYKECSNDNDCWDIICNNMHGVCKEGKCEWYHCSDNPQCIDNYCCESNIPSSTNKQCFKKGIYTNDKYLCESK